MCGSPFPACTAHTSWGDSAVNLARPNARKLLEMSRHPGLMLPRGRVILGVSVIDN